MKTRNIGLLCTIVVSFIILAWFYQGPLSNPHQTFFATGGDGLKDYFNTVYFVVHDSTLFQSGSMNYPHGEHVFYTGNQPSISFILRFIHNNIAEIDHKVVGILNLTMLFSVVLGAVFLYLLLVHLKLPVFYSVLISVGIIFLSPQLARMPGHFSLSYVFAVPAMLYLIARFHEKNRYLTSIIIGLFVLWALGTHVYMLGFHASIILLYWMYKFAFFSGTWKTRENYFHLAIQFIIPLIIFIAITAFTDPVSDRTGYPWGFLFYRAYPESVFLPLGKPYAQFLYNLSNFKYINWEGIAFVGMVATIGFLIAFVFFFFHIAKNRLKSIPAPSDNLILNIFLWASLIMLVYSFGLPFIIGDAKYLIHYIGPLKQMRGIARFSWLFFYIINIFVFYHIWHLRNKGLNKVVWIILVVVTTSFLYYDAYLNVRFWSKFVNNQIPALSDHQNTTDENLWIKDLDIANFQASIPIPYFHIGSENIWVDAACGITRPTYIVSWKTGLPSMGVMLSRTSFSQTYENIELLIEPYRRPAILDKFIPGKSFLIITRDDCAQIPAIQQKLIDRSLTLYESAEFNLLELPWDSLISHHENPFHRILANMEQKDLFVHGEYLTGNELKDFQVNIFPENEDEQYYKLPGSFSDRLRKGSWIYHKDIPEMKPGTEYILSFWVHDLYRDLFMRSRLELQLRDSLNHGHDAWTPELFRMLEAFDGNWALIEKRFTFNNPGDMIRWRITNDDLRRSDYTVSHVMVRDANRDIYRKGDGWLMKNNRFYKP